MCKHLPRQSLCTKMLGNQLSARAAARVIFFYNRDSFHQSPIVVYKEPVRAADKNADTGVDWPAFAGHVTGDHYSMLSRINRTNVKNLRIAWTYATGESGNIQTNPVIVGGTFYAFTPSQKVIALDAA